MTDPMQTVIERLDQVKQTPNGHEARCPAHDDRHASLSVSRGCDGRVLLHCHAGCSPIKVCQALGLRLGDLFPKASNHVASGTGGGTGGASRGVSGSVSGGRIAATYDYVDADGVLLYQVVRFEPKGFRQRRPNPSQQNKWTWNLNGTPRVLYRLPELVVPE